MPPASNGALFVISTPNASQAGPVAVWITAAGWAAAAHRILGQSWLLTPTGVLTPQEARAQASSGDHTPDSRPRWRDNLPTVVKTAGKDLRRLSRALRFRDSALEGPWVHADLAFVWQHHDMFQSAGIRVARRLRKPLVVFLDAPQVWEARQWGIRRPVWGPLIERFGERPQLAQADLVACVSDEVASQAMRLGVPEARILVTPCSVDTSEFKPDLPTNTLKRSLAIENKFVVGWLGGFRPFHGIDALLDVASATRETHPQMVYLLVGDGIERRRLQDRAKREQLTNVVFSGLISHDEVPQYISVMDVATILAPEGDAFHYSPLKLREYMACGIPVVAPKVGELSRWLSDGEDALLIEGDLREGFAAAVKRLYGSPVLRQRLSTRARTRALSEGSWEQQVRKSLAMLRGESRP